MEITLSFHVLKMLKYLLLFVTSLFSISFFIDWSFAWKLYEDWWTCVGGDCSVIQNDLHTYDSDFSLTWKVVQWTVFISFTHNNDEEFFLKKFDSNSEYYTYNVSKKFWNLSDGKNIYHARFYDYNNKLLWKEQIYKVTFLNKEKIGNYVIRKWNEPKNEETEIEGDLPSSIYYTKSGNKNTSFFRLKKDFWNSILDLWNGYSFVYTAFFNKNLKKWDDPWDAKFRITYKKTWTIKTTSSNEISWVDFSAYMFNNPSITKYANNYFIIETWGWHEGVSNIFVFSPKTMKIYDLYKLEKKVLWNDAYPVMTAVVKDGKVTISEFKYCCDTIDNPGGYEKIVIDIEKEKLVSREPIK